MKTTALTAYGLVGTDYVRMTAVILETGAYAFRRADGSDAILPVLPTTFRTSGDMTNVTSKLGHRVNMAAVPSVALPNHVWKGVFDLDGIAAKMAGEKGAAIVAGLKATYAEELEAAA